MRCRRRHVDDEPPPRLDRRDRVLAAGNTPSAMIAFWTEIFQRAGLGVAI
jgi:hypothetical protein